MNKTIQVWIGALLVALLGSFSIASAQEQVAPLPIDPGVRVGKLPNGLTYFIRHNQQPKERANFYIVQRVGSMQEEDNQSGLAHFLEHMAFNGSRHFAGKGMINYLERIGVKFGSELNAYTSFDETRYTIMDAPVSDQSVIDSCVLILRDWSDGIALLDDEIDNERGVIQEEWRQSENGNTRTTTTMLKRTFPDIRYGHRLPIGSMDVVRNFTYKELRDYYHKWYRPDLQGLVIVGDVDVDYVEKVIKETFADMPAPVNPAERIYVQVPDRKEPISIVVTDPENTRTMISFSYYRDALSREMKGSVAGVAMDYVTSIITSMMNERFSDIAHKPNAPFVYAGMSMGPVMGFVMTEDETSFIAIAHEGRTKEALDAIVAEMKRAKEYGFTAAEYERAKAELISSYENLLNSKDNRTNTSYADAYSDYFTKGGYIPGIEAEYQLMNNLAQGFTLDLINQSYQQFTEPSNLVVTLLAQEKEGVKYPTESELLEQYNKALQQEVEPYADAFAGVELMDKLPEPGKLLSEQTGLKFGATLWTFDNGAKVYVLPTDYKKNDIRIYGVSNGGYLQYANEIGSINTRASRQFSTIGGLDKFSATDLMKVLAGKVASSSTGISDIKEWVSGSSSDKDIETMFQLLYLNMTSLRSDTEAFESAIEKTKAMLKASAADPLTAFWENTSRLIYPDNDLSYKLKAEELDQIDYAKMLEAYKARFANASDFTFFLVGSFDKEKALPLVARYIGSLPGNHTVEPDQSSKAFAKAKKSNQVKMELSATTPMGLSLGLFVKDGTYDLKENMIIDILGEVLNQQFFKSIREDEGGTYGVAVQSNTSRAPRGEESLLVFFQTNPEQLDHLNAKVKSELKQVADGTINIDEYFNKTILNMKKSYQENQRENSYWVDILVDYYFNNDNAYDKYLETLDSITTDDVRKALKDILANGRYLEQVAVTAEK